MNSFLTTIKNLIFEKMITTIVTALIAFITGAITMTHLNNWKFQYSQFYFHHEAIMTGLLVFFISQTIFLYFDAYKKQIIHNLFDILWSRDLTPFCKIHKKQLTVQYVGEVQKTQKQINNKLETFISEGYSLFSCPRCSDSKKVKSLDFPYHFLTIDQIREIINKNKKRHENFNN